MNNVYNALIDGELGTYTVEWNRRRFTRVDAISDRWLVPGFVDMHIHGAFGIDFMSASESEMRELCRKLREVGYEGFLPTTVTASPEDVMRAISQMPDDPMILGFHLEGPFISPQFPGAQPPAAIAQPSGLSDGWTPILFDPRMKVITLAPEVPGCLDLAQRLAKRGVRVSMGHTNATSAEAALAFEAGAVQSTHTYNAMRALHHREPGVLGFSMANDEIWTELIYDRLHVSPTAAEILLRCKPMDRVLAVSDSTMATGLPSGRELTMWGMSGVTGDREVRLKDGTLAGSAIHLLDAFRNLFVDFGPEVAIYACCLNPRDALKMGEPTVWVELDSRLELVSVKTP